MNKKLEKKIRRIHTRYIWANTQNCKACWECISNCPTQTIGKAVFLWHKHIVFRDAESCIGCKKCINVCPHEVFSKEIPDSIKIFLDKKGIVFK